MAPMPCTETSNLDAGIATLIEFLFAPPAIALVADTRREQTTMTPITEYSMWITVNWRNADNGRRGTVKLRARAPRNTWQAVLHPGRGRVSFEIHQSVTAILAVPGVNPQTAVCRGSATAV